VEVKTLLTKIRIKNCFAFNEEVTLDLEADMRTKRFPSNVFQNKNINVIKSAAIYGPNNTGKTCLLKTIVAIKNILLNKGNSLQANLFTGSNVCEVGVSFLHDERIYNYEIKYDSKNQEYLYEKMSETVYDEYHNAKEEIHFLKNNPSYHSPDETLQKAMPTSSNDNILIYTINTDVVSYLGEIKSFLVSFASKITFISFEGFNLRVDKTIEILKNDEKYRSFVISFIKNCDLYLDDFKYDPNIQLPQNLNDEKEPIIVDMWRLISTYRGVDMQSITFDSLGTKKIIALAGYLVEILRKNGILLIDEINSSIHFKLARSIVSLFNNDINNNSQLIFATHDISLMDIQKMFRKEQIWFTHKDKERTYLYSLAEFTAEKGIRETSDIIDKYAKGVFGAIPDPNLIKFLYEIVHEQTANNKL
jgi:AAA15 family ATPase/GTPase